MRLKTFPETPKRQKKAKKIRIVLVLTAVAVALSFVTVALSRNPSKATQKKYVATKEIVRDRVTGQLRKPTPEETSAMVAQLKMLTNRSTDGLKANTRADGTVSVNLEGRFQGVVLGRDTADGGTEIRCVFTMEEAVEFLGLQESTSPDQ